MELRKVIAGLFLPFSFFTVTAQSSSSGALKQGYSITGTVINKETSEPIEFGAVGLFKQTDSSFVQGVVTNAKGKFNISFPDTDKYFLKITYLGYDTKYVAVGSLKQTTTDLDAIEINPYNTLKTVEIVDERPPYQVYDDKKVYRVDQDPVSTTGSTSDILQNIPSVSIDDNGVVKLRGGSVEILIDGKPSGLLGISRQDILDYIPASMIESIEIINNPPAKYDAHGEAGIINIILKKPKTPGLMGTFIGGAGTGNKYTGSADVSLRSSKFTVYLSGDLREYNMDGNRTKSRDRYTTKLSLLNHLNENQTWTDHKISNNDRIRVEYRINPKNELSGSFLYKTNYGLKSPSAAYTEYDSLGKLIKLYDRDDPDSTKDHSYDYTLSYERKFKKKNQSLTANLFYTTTDENSFRDITQEYYNIKYYPSYVPFKAPPLTEYISDKKNKRHVMGQVDYVQPLFKHGKLETGIKSTIGHYGMNYQFSKYNYSLNEYFLIPTYTNHFTYNEEVNAAYLSFKDRYKKLTYSAGVRAEQTIVNTELDTLTPANTYVIKSTSYKNFVDFFPSAHLSYKINKSSSLALSYSKRIHRPGVKYVNPFYNYIDAVTVHTGNPSLQPEYTHSFDLSYTKYLKNITLNSSVYYRYTTHTFDRISYLDTSGTAYTTYANFNSKQDLGLEVYFNAQLCKWYRFNCGLNGYKSLIDGTNIGSNYSSNSYSWTGKLNNFFTLWGKLSLQWTFNYVSPIVTPLDKKHEVFFSDLSLKKEFFKKRLAASVRLSDVFLTKKDIIETYNPVYYSYTTNQMQSRILYLSITYRPVFYKMKYKELSKEIDEETDNTSETEE